MATTTSVGSLVLDIRANLATLQADMNDVKSKISQSSRQISQQMSSDMRETRQTLALLRDDFGVALPRELRTAVANVEVLRDAILTLQDAFVLIGFANFAIEAAEKMGILGDKTNEETKAAQEAAKAEDQFFESLKTGNEAHAERLRLIGLIGKTSDQVYASDKAHNEELIHQQKILLAGKIAEVQAAQAAMLAEIAQIRGQSDFASGENPLQEIQALKDKFNEFSNSMVQPILEAQQKLQALEDEGVRLTKQHEEDKRQEYLKTSKQQQQEMQQALSTIEQIKTKELAGIDPILTPFARAVPVYLRNPYALI